MHEIYAALFDRIIEGNYERDTHLKEEALAEEFGVSRTPVRETLRQLEQDGLVQLLPKRGARILGFTVDDVEEIYEIRESLEVQALETSAPLISIQGLMDIRNLIQQSAPSQDFHLHEQIDARLHGYFIIASGKRRLIAMLNQLFRLIQRFRELGFKDKIVREMAAQEHLALIDALTARNREEASMALRKHIRTSRLNAVSLLVRGSGL